MRAGKLASLLYKKGKSNSQNLSYLPMTLASSTLRVGLLLSFSHKHKLNFALQLDLGRSKKNVQEEKERAE